MTSLDGINGRSIQTLLRALSIKIKNPEISVGTKKDFSVGKNLFHLIVNAGTAPIPLPDGTPRWLPSRYKLSHEKRVNGTWNSVQNVPTGKMDFFGFSTFSGNFPVGQTHETFSIYCRPEISGISTKRKAPWGGNIRFYFRFSCKLPRDYVRENVRELLKLGLIRG